MKKLWIAIALVGALSATTTQAALEGTVKISANSPYQNGQGGEFWAVSSGLGNLGNFATFCTEVNEHLAFGYTYDYNRNVGAVLGGGIPGGALAIDSFTGMTMDTISYGTAWLYSKMRNGTLTKADGTGSYLTAATRNANAGDLQKAIWWLEGESSGVNNGYVSLANAAAGSAANALADSGGAFGVIALNLYNGQEWQWATAPDGKKYKVNQDVLAIVPEPTTIIAGALLLLPFGASTIRFLRKNRTA